MCEECFTNPCHSRCPNNTSTPVCECEWCGYEIYEGDTMYILKGETVCEACVDDCKTFAEFEEG